MNDTITPEMIAEQDARLQQSIAELSADVMGIRNERDYLRGKCDELLIERAQLIGALTMLISRINMCQLGPVHSGLGIADEIAIECDRARTVLALVAK